LLEETARDGCRFYLLLLNLMNSKQQKKQPSEWVGAPVLSTLCERKEVGRKETVTPSDRELRLRQRTKRIEDQASDANLTTERAIGSKMKFNQQRQKVPNPETQRYIVVPKPLVTYPHPRSRILTRELNRYLFRNNYHCPLIVAYRMIT